ncbi:MAG: ABC transporter permease [Eubacterium sp.]|jgi:cell division transport system permease protein|nr:ABC transporter permease [Eubacterium sp.]
MTASSIRYLFKEGFRNTWTNRMMSIASICVLMSCLVLMGCATMIFLNIDSLLGRIEEENVVMVYIEDDTTASDLKQMEKSLNEIRNIKEVEFIAKEVAWQQQLDTMEESHAAYFTELSSEIPLPNAYKITIDDLSLFDDTINNIKKLDHIETIRENKDLAKKLVSIRHGIEIIAVVIVAVLLAISIFIISNTIKLTVYSRRLEISIMKSVGATNGFVRLPFVVEGMILGIISGVISLGLVWGFYEFAIRQFKDLINSLNLTALNFADYSLVMLGAFVAIGILTGVGGSIITMGRYLNKEGSEISGV